MRFPEELNGSAAYPSPFYPKSFLPTYLIQACQNFPILAYALRILSPRGPCRPVVRGPSLPWFPWPVSRGLRCSVAWPSLRGRPPGVVRGPSSVVRGPSSVVRGPSSVVRGPSSVVRGPSSVVRGPSSVVRGPSSVVRPEQSVKIAFPPFSSNEFYQPLPLIFFITFSGMPEYFSIEADYFFYNSLFQKIFPLWHPK
jgi:hypothetical protein